MVRGIEISVTLLVCLMCRVRALLLIDSYPMYWQGSNYFEVLILRKDIRVDPRLFSQVNKRNRIKLTIHCEGKLDICFFQKFT